jgi:CBS domain-containing protein
MQVRDVMRRDPYICSPGMSLAQAGRIMAEAHCGVLPVVGNGEEERVVGVITDRDICLAVAKRDRPPSEIQVRQVMSGEVYGCAADDDLRDALRTMCERQVRRLPVVTSTGRLQGILALDDVIVVARPHPMEGFDGPFYADIANTLRTICQKQQSAIAHLAWEPVDQLC